MSSTQSNPHLTHAEILVLGTGSRLLPVPVHIRQFLRNKGVTLEVQDTVRPQTLHALHLVT